MRVLHAANFGGTRPGGFVPLVAALSRRLSARGDAFSLVVPNVPDATWHAMMRDAGADVYVVDTPAQAARVASDIRPDVAHVHFYGWEPAVTLALWTTHARLFWHAHSACLWDRAPARNLRSWVKYRAFGSRVERFVAVSAALAEELVTIGAPRQRVVTVRNAVDAARFRPPSPDERAAARAAYGFTNEDCVVLFFGRDPKLKGADVLVSALARLERTTVVAIATPAVTRNELASVARVVAFDDVDDLVPVYWASDVVALPSRGEGFAFVLLEAAMAGTPVVASDLPALREVGAAYERVRFVPVGDAVELANEVRQAFLTPRASSVAPLDSPETWARAMTDLYDDVEDVP